MVNPSPFQSVVESDPSVFDVAASAPGPEGALPLTPEQLRSAPSGDLFGWTQNVGMGWNPAELNRKEFLILSTQGGIRDTLHDVQPSIEVAGVSDLVVSGLKVSGNSQQRKLRYLLHHGTLLYDFDAGAVGRFLREPARQPEYRRRRSHGEFVGNLEMAPALLQERLRTHWMARVPLVQWPREEVARLVHEKYARSDWTRRR